MTYLLIKHHDIMKLIMHHDILINKASWHYEINNASWHTYVCMVRMTTDLELRNLHPFLGYICIAHMHTIVCADMSKLDRKKGWWHFVHDSKGWGFVHNFNGWPSLGIMYEMSSARDGFRIRFQGMGFVHNFNGWPSYLTSRDGFLM